MGNFYCQNESIDTNFSIKEWNKTFHALELTNLTESEKNEILIPKKCKEQCIDCACIVGKRRLTTNLLNQ